MLLSAARFVLPALCLVLAACATQASQPAPGATFVLVRHAEKATTNPEDPSLTPAGQDRAQRLADTLAGIPLSAVYATAYRRTQQTAAPAARTHHLTVTTYDAKQPAADFAAALRERHHDGRVLVVGHSNTIPGIASALCSCAVPDMPETEYDRLITVHVDPDGNATMAQSRQD